MNTRKEEFDVIASNIHDKISSLAKATKLNQVAPLHKQRVQDESSGSSPEKSPKKSMSRQISQTSNQPGQLQPPM